MPSAVEVYIWQGRCDNTLHFHIGVLQIRKHYCGLYWCSTSSIVLSSMFQTLRRDFFCSPLIPRAQDKRKQASLPFEWDDTSGFLSHLRHFLKGICT